MNADFNAQMVNLRDQLASLRPEFGVPTARSLIVVYRRANQPSEYLEISPRPIIEQVNPKLVAAMGQNLRIQLELDDLQVRDISLKYSREEILGSYYIIDGELQGSSVVGGFEAERIPGMPLTQKTLTWDLVLRRRKLSGS